MTEAAADSVTLSDMIGFAITLFVFFCSQAVVLYIWYQRHKREQKKDRDEQFTRLQGIVEKDIGALKLEVEEVRQDMEKQERVQCQRNEQLHGHLRSLEASRPTREEMEKNMAQLRDLVISTKKDLERAVGDGFKQLDRRFDEFKDYAKELWGNPRR